MNRFAFAVLCSVTVTPVTARQTLTPAFEVASIRENKSGLAAGSSTGRPGGSYNVTNMTLRSLIWVAYGIPSQRIIGGPDWVDSTHFDVAAKAAGDPRPEEVREMIKSLMRERFKLVAREEKRDLPVYALVIARKDGVLGPRMRANPLDCADAAALKKARAEASADSIRPCELRFMPSRLRLGTATVASMLDNLAEIAGRPVVDRTGLSGTYDIDLQWAPTPDADGVSIFTAIQEQLGLRLEPSTAPLDVVIIESAQRPTEN
jgi:uncharacterized protein (TIGR03435 family)